MPLPVNVRIHASQFPDAVRRDLLESLRTRRVNHKFHYDSVKQTEKWLALHQACSPSRTDPDCEAVYQRSFESVAARISSSRAPLIGLGCGGGQKDARLLELLRAHGRETSYTPTDVSTAMVLVAREAAIRIIPAENCFPLVCDLARAEDLPAILDCGQNPGDARLLTFFGMIPNFEPQVILPRLAALVRPHDHLLFSANLAPGADYGAGVQAILPLYNNALTRDWLLSFPLDLGIPDSAGELRFTIEENAPAHGLKRVAAHFHFRHPCSVPVLGERFEFAAGESLRLFFSYRHTPALVRALLAEHELQVVEEWITRSGEEGVFLVRREAR